MNAGPGFNAEGAEDRRRFAEEFWIPCLTSIIHFPTSNCVGVSPAKAIAPIDFAGSPISILPRDLSMQQGDTTDERRSIARGESLGEEATSPAVPDRCARAVPLGRSGMRHLPVHTQRVRFTEGCPAIGQSIPARLGHAGAVAIGEVPEFGPSGGQGRLRQRGNRRLPDRRRRCPHHPLPRVAIVPGSDAAPR